MLTVACMHDRLFVLAFFLRKGGNGNIANGTTVINRCLSVCSVWVCDKNSVHEIKLCVGLLSGSQLWPA